MEIKSPTLEIIEPPFITYFIPTDDGTYITIEICLN